MLTRLFDFDLPSELIALRPAEPRESARLLLVGQDGRLEHRSFKDLSQLLRKGDILSFNDSKVIRGRLTGTRPSRDPGGPAVSAEITLHKRNSPSRYLALVQPAKRLRVGDRLHLGANLMATVTRREAGEIELEFDRGGQALDRAIAEVGVMPLPPYIAKNRAPDSRDLIDYQTIYAREGGSVAAPTAGLHFSKPMLDELRESGIETAFLTLHVGAGTFLPVSAEDTGEHKMHAERAMLDVETATRLNRARAAGGRTVAVGTTALRTLESAADEAGQVHAFKGDTSIFITPGYRFRAVDVLLTNFHLPRSTLFMLVSAFMGLETMKAAYAEAIAQRYRFYSYGDACLLLRPR
jgi:S-adenosylmethionine:tRNA ribosyltransferase-isomerase